MRKESFEFDSIMYPYNNENAIKVIVNQHSVEEYVDYINENRIERARVVMPDLNFLKLCPSLKYMYISPAYNATEHFSFAPLYEMPDVKFLICDNMYGEKEDLCAEIDFSKLKGLEFLSVTFNKGIRNLESCNNLKTLRVSKYKCKERNLEKILRSEKLDTLELSECNLQSLDGIKQLGKIQCLYLNYNRALSDINALKEIRGSLRTLYIQNCSNIKDFSVLGELENLEALELIGNNNIPNLNFLNMMKNLKTFVFEYNILDGNLSQCLSIPNVHCNKNRRHYNYADCDLPKGEYFFGNETIEEWRRIE